MAVADERLAGPVTAALAGRHAGRHRQAPPFPYAFACPAGVMRAGATNSGTTETFSPWGDGVAEPGA